MFSIPIQPTSIFFGLEEHSKKEYGILRKLFVCRRCTHHSLLYIYQIERRDIWKYSVVHGYSILTILEQRTHALYAEKYFSRLLLARVLFGHQVCVWINNVLTLTNAAYYIDIFLTKVTSSFPLFMNIFYSVLYDRYLRVLSKSPTHLRPAYW